MIQYFRANGSVHSSWHYRIIEFSPSHLSLPQFLPYSFRSCARPYKTKCNLSQVSHSFSAHSKYLKRIPATFFFSSLPFCVFVRLCFYSHALFVHCIAKILYGLVLQKMQLQYFLMKLNVLNISGLCLLSTIMVTTNKLRFFFCCYSPFRLEIVGIGNAQRLTT